MSELVRKVKVWALSVKGDPGLDETYKAIVDTGASKTVIPRRVLKGIKHHVLPNQHVYYRGREVPVALCLFQLEADANGDGDCEPRAILVAVSDRLARQAGHGIDIILGHDYLQDAEAVIRFSEPHSVSCRRRNGSRRRAS